MDNSISTVRIFITSFYYFSTPVEIFDIIEFLKIFFYFIIKKNYNQLENMHNNSPSAKQISLGVMWNFGVYGIRMLSAIIVSAIMVRGLGNTQYGIYSLLTSILMFASLICKFSFDTALLRYVPEYKKQNDTEGLKTFIYRILFYQLGIWLVLLVAFYIAGDSLSSFYKVPLGPFLFIGMISMLISLYSLILETVLTAYYKIKIQATLSVVSGVLQIILLYIFIGIYHLGIMGCLLSLICKDILLIIFYTKNIFEMFSESPSEGAVHIRGSRLLNFVTPYFFVSLLSQLILSQSEVFYLGYFSTMNDVGIYNLAYTFPPKFIGVIPDILRNIISASITDFYLQDKSYLKKSVELYFKLLFLVTAPLSIGGALIVDKLVVMIYGQDMETAGTIAQILFIVHTFNLLPNPYTFVARTTENLWVAFRISAISAFISISFNIMLISRYGLPGAVISTSLALFISAVLSFLIYRNHFPFVEIPWKYIGKCYLSTAGFFIVLPFKHVITNPLSFFIAVIIMVISWILMAKIIKLFEEDEIKLIERLSIPYTKQIVSFFR